MKVAGIKLTCDNCEREVFLAKKDDKVLDGGFTRVEVCEDAPEGWRRESVLGEFVDLCPECIGKLESAIRREMPKLAERAGVSLW